MFWSSETSCDRHAHTYAIEYETRSRDELAGAKYELDTLIRNLRSVAIREVLVPITCSAYQDVS